MLNVNELESKWLRYKIKSYIPHAIIAVSTIIITLSVVTIYNLKPTVKVDVHVDKNLQVSPTKTLPLVEQNTTIKEKSQQAIIANSNLAIIEKNKNPLQNSTPLAQSNEQKKDKIIMSPSLDFMVNMRTNIPAKYEIVTPAKDIQNIVIEEPIQENVLDLSEKAIDLESSQEDVSYESKKGSISINRQNTHDDIKYVIERFKKNNNPALSLFIAKKYYELGDYHKAYNYSLVTNEINHDIEASWLIFAKSLVKLNEKEMAIKTLTQYIDHSKSNRAQILLDEINAGKFK
jgi:tetratricopeptide (TPR) repeat protein